MRYAIALTMLVLALAGCDKTLRPDPPPKIVRVEIKVPVSLCPDGGSDCALLRDCYNEPAKEQTYNEAKRLANMRDASLRECNARMGKIREAQPAKE